MDMGQLQVSCGIGWSFARQRGAPEQNWQKDIGPGWTIYI